MEISATKRMARNFSWLLIGNLINGGMVLAITIYIARVLGAAYFGLLQFAQAFYIYLMLFVDSGLSTYGTREISKNPVNAGKVTINIFLIRIVIAAVITAVSVWIVYLLPLSVELRLILSGTFIFVVCRALNTEWVYQGLERMEFISFSRILYSLFSLIIIYLLVRHPVDAVRVPFIQFFCGLAAAMVLLLILFRKHVVVDLKYLQPEIWLSYFVQALPLGASFILVQIYNNLDTIMLGFMDRAEVVGYYSAAYRIFYVCLGLFSIWQTTAVPTATRRIHEDKEKANQFLTKYLRLTMMIFVPLVTLVALAAPLIVGVVFGAEYSPATLALRVLIWALLVMTIGSTYGILVLVPAGLFNEVLAAVLTGAVVNVILNFLLIPRFSMIGAAIATIFAELFAGAILYSFSRKVLNLGLLAGMIKPAIVTCFASVMFMLVMYLAPVSLFFKYSAAILVFVIVYGGIILSVEKKYIFEFVNELIMKRIS